MASDNRITTELDQYEEFDYTMRGLYMTRDSGYYSQDSVCPDLGFEDPAFLADQNLDHPLGLNPFEIDHGRALLHTKQCILDNRNSVDIGERHDESQTQHDHFEQAVTAQDPDSGFMQLAVRLHKPGGLQ
jgi:hypothetical protein